MFISKNFIFLELQKTASSHIVGRLDRLVPGKRIGQHNRASSDLLATGRKIIGSIRDPWDWYLSLWSYGCCQHGGLYHRLTDLTKGVSERVTNWNELYSDGRDPRLFRRWLQSIHDPHHARELGQGYADTTLPGFAGFYTFRYLRLFMRDLGPLSDGSVGDQAALAAYADANNLLDYVIRNESLESDLIRVLQTLNWPVTNSQAQDTVSAPRTNTSSRDRDDMKMYDDETFQLVAQREQFIVQKFGYDQRMEGQSSRSIAVSSTAQTAELSESNCSSATAEVERMGLPSEEANAMASGKATVPSRLASIRLWHRALRSKLRPSLRSIHSLLPRR